jgi:uncharacterized protein (DUF934 family)
MPNKPMIKESQIIDNDWRIVETADQLQADGKQLVSLSVWQSNKAALTTAIAAKNIGLFLQNDQCVSEFAEELQQFSVIAIHFPVFMDGRGFSLARLLRDRYHYQGEIRATGAIIRDQLCYLKRCGFTAFDMDESIDLTAALASLNDFTESYQVSADQKTPLFRRRA